MEEWSTQLFLHSPNLILSNGGGNRGWVGIMFLPKMVHLNGEMEGALKMLLARVWLGVGVTNAGSKLRTENTIYM